MAIGSDFFKWFRFMIQIVQVFAHLFGDESDKEELVKNGFTDAIIKPPAATPATDKSAPK